MDQELDIKGLRIQIYLPEKGRGYPHDDFAGISISIDDGGHAQSEHFDVRDTAEITAFLGNAMVMLTRSK